MDMDLIVYNIGQKYFLQEITEVNCIIEYYIRRLLLVSLRNVCYDGYIKFNNSVYLSPCPS